MYYFIVNPKSSSGKGAVIWKTIEPILREEQIPYHPFFTRDWESTARLAYRLCTKKAPAVIVAVGGDGTANDVLNGLTNFQQITFGYIPTGSGNDLARGLCLESDPVKALRSILSPSKISHVNMGSLHTPDFSRRFLVSSGIGFDASVCEGALHSKIKDVLNRLNLGKLTYTGIALRQLILSPRVKAALILDGGTPVTYSRLLFAAAMNLPYEGGGFKFCPDAKGDDDHLNLILVEKISKPKILLLFPTAYFGRHTRFHGIHILPFQEARLIVKTPLCLHTDGEIPGKGTEIVWSLLPEKLRFIVG